MSNVDARMLTRASFLACVWSAIKCLDVLGWIWFVCLFIQNRKFITQSTLSCHLCIDNCSRIKNQDRPWDPDFHWGPFAIRPRRISGRAAIIFIINVWMCQDGDFVCLFIYLEQKVYYIVNTLLSPMHRQLLQDKNPRQALGSLFSLGSFCNQSKTNFRRSLDSTQSKKNFYQKNQKIYFTQKMFQTKKIFCKFFFF